MQVQDVMREKVLAEIIAVRDGMILELNQIVTNLKAQIEAMKADG